MCKGDYFCFSDFLQTFAEKCTYLGVVELQSFFRTKVLNNKSSITYGLICDLLTFLDSKEARKIPSIQAARLSSSIIYNILRAIEDYSTNWTSDDSIRQKICRSLKERKNLRKGYALVKLEAFLNFVVIAPEKRERFQASDPPTADDGEWMDMEMDTLHSVISACPVTNKMKLKKVLAKLSNFERKYARLKAKIKDCPKCN